MDPPQAPPPSLPKCASSTSVVSDASHTAQDYIRSQLQLEADARDALPYQFDTCTRPLGALRQSVFACLTCSPPPASAAQLHVPAGVCYSCSISCHGEHELVELFTKRDFVCDCGTMRIPQTGCELRKAQGVEAREGNKYDQNYAGRFCGCGEQYDPVRERGTMFQCLGLGTVEDGGCGEDWWHPECLMGLPRTQPTIKEQKTEANGALETVKEEREGEEEQAQTSGVANAEQHHEEEPPLPPGFPAEDDFDHLICYKCANAFPFIKQYAGAPGFLPAVRLAKPDTNLDPPAAEQKPAENGESKKRKTDDEDAIADGPELKRTKSEGAVHDTSNDDKPSATNTQAPAALNSDSEPTAPHHTTLAPPPTVSISLFLKDDFRDHLCKCANCFPLLKRQPQLLEEEESYEPPISESDAASNAAGSLAGRSTGTGSLLERGEAALSNMDRVRAIEGVMAYNHVRDKVKAFLQPFAESGQAVGAEDIKEYFAKLRGDEQAGREAAVGAEGGVQGDGRREQGGY